MKTKNMFLMGFHNIMNTMASILLVRSILEMRENRWIMTA
jgi:hypothetical protein